MSRKTPIDRFNESYTVSDFGCWVWNKAGEKYGYIRINGRSVRAHRFSYFYFNGDIPDKKIVMHKCDNTKCVNPDHLEIGTQKKNIRDCVKRKRHANSKKTHCKNGHPFNEENTAIEKTAIGTKKRVCKICKHKSQKKHKEKNMKGRR